MNKNSKRNIHDIICKIINKIPEENTYLINKLLDIIKSSVYLAPEIKNDELLWINLHNILTKHIGYKRPNEGWMKDVIDIYVGDINV